ncbi:hypothetical protein PGB90_009071 [Kerria lacca]
MTQPSILASSMLFTKNDINNGVTYDENLNSALSPKNHALIPSSQALGKPSPLSFVHSPTITDLHTNTLLCRLPQSLCIPPSLSRILSSFCSTCFHQPSFAPHSPHNPRLFLFWLHSPAHHNFNILSI